MNFVKEYFWQHRKSAGCFLLFCFIFGTAFTLYHLPLEAVLYPVLVCGVLGLLFLCTDMKRAYKKHCRLMRLQELSAEMLQDFPMADTIAEKDYQEVIRKLCQEQRQLTQTADLRYSDMMDYYTLWVHQIKTPIASMRLNLQNEDSALSRMLMEELQRIEQYVEMVLYYLKLDGDSMDYVIREYDLDSMVRQAVKKFAGQFIRRGIRLDYQPLCCRVITDEKWMTFVIEQVLSNALKYTKSGVISITLKEPCTLCISDTGIGIAPQDLPRIFEKGYTGYNGRTDKKASGIGLYLCRRICSNLNHSITAQSVPGQGTRIFLHMEQKRLEEIL